jgi:hypothetical protein
MENATKKGTFDNLNMPKTLGCDSKAQHATKVLGFRLSIKQPIVLLPWGVILRPNMQPRFWGLDYP